MKGFSLKDWIEEYRSLYEKGHNDPYNEMAYKYDDLESVTKKQSDELQKSFLKIEKDVVKGLDFTGKTEYKSINMPCCARAAEILIKEIRDGKFNYEEDVDFRDRYEYKMSGGSISLNTGEIGKMAEAGCDLYPLIEEIVKQGQEGKIPNGFRSLIYDGYETLFEYLTVCMEYTSYKDASKLFDSYGKTIVMSNYLESNDPEKIEFVNNNYNNLLDLTLSAQHKLNQNKDTLKNVLNNIIEQCKKEIPECIAQFDLDFVSSAINNQLKLNQMINNMKVALYQNIVDRQNQSVMKDNFSLKFFQYYTALSEFLRESEKVSTQFLDNYMTNYKNSHMVSRK